MKQFKPTPFNARKSAIIEHNRRTTIAVVNSFGKRKPRNISPMTYEASVNNLRIMK